MAPWGSNAAGRHCPPRPWGEGCSSPEITISDIWSLVSRQSSHWLQKRLRALQLQHKKALGWEQSPINGRGVDTALDIYGFKPVSPTVLSPHKPGLLKRSLRGGKNKVVKVQQSHKTRKNTAQGLILEKAVFYVDSFESMSGSVSRWRGPRER